MKKLEEFTNRVCENLYADDKTFHHFMSYFLLHDEKQRVHEVLTEWEQHLPVWNAMADEAARPEHLPRIEKQDRVGNPVERVVVPMQTRLIRHRVVEAGIFRGKTEFEKFSKIYLLSQLGESGVTCPLACTDGLIRVLSAEGSEYLKTKYLDMLLSSDTPLAGSQFVTERAGGSDVGAIEAIARKDADGNYRITGKKWYCSTPEEFYLIAARTEDAEPGTKGVSIYFVPRQIPNPEKNGPDYVPNHLSFIRLKDKLGTQSLPTAEIDFDGAHAHMIGHESEGFSNLMSYVINCSRTHNAANALGFLRRAFVEARNYAEQRVAFDKQIINYPLVAEYLVDILSELSAKQAVFLHMLKHIDQNGWIPKDNETAMWQRFLINMLKYRTSSQLTNLVKQAILVFGANGVINDFSILPRLLRDSLVIETWEGTHNTLCLQIVRDVNRFDFFGRMHQEIDAILEDWPDDVLRDSKQHYAQVFDKGREFFKPANLYNPHWMQTHAARFVNHFADLLETGLLVRIGVEQNNCNFLIQSSYLQHKLFGDRFASFTSPTIQHLSDICLDLIREVPIDIDVK